MAANKEIDKFISERPVSVHKAMKSFRKQLLALVPDSQERLAYGVPTIFHAGKKVVGFGATASGKVSFYTMRPALVTSLQSELSGYKSSGSTIQFNPDKPLPKALVKKIVSLCLEDIAETNRAAAEKKQSKKKRVNKP